MSIAIAHRVPASSTSPFAIAASKYDTPFTDAEVGAYEHWILGGTSASLTGLIAGKSLTPQGSVTYNADHVQLSAGANQGLVTDYADSATPEDTMCVVMRDNAGNNVRFMGNDSHLPILSNNDNSLIYTESGIHTVDDTGFNLTANTWYFIGFARSYVGFSNITRVFIGGLGTHENAEPGTYSPDVDDNLGIGTVSGSASGTLEFAEFALFDRCLTLSDMEGIYERAKVRQADRGLIIT